jgi:hypothetical protein
MVSMAKVKLKVNMIFGGSHYSFGTVLDKDEVPLNLRKSKYLTAPDTVEAVRLREEEVDLEPLFDEVSPVIEEPEPETEELEEYEEPQPKSKFKKKFRG